MLDCVQRRAAAERGEPSEQNPFAFVEEVVTPVDQASQRLLPWLRRSRTDRQQRVAVVDPLHEVFDGHRAKPSRGKLDGQRESVQPLQQLLRRGTRLALERQFYAGGRSPSGEQLGGFVACQR